MTNLGGLPLDIQKKLARGAIKRKNLDQYQETAGWESSSKIQYTCIVCGSTWTKTTETEETGFDRYSTTTRIRGIHDTTCVIATLLRKDQS